MSLSSTIFFKKFQEIFRETREISRNYFSKIGTDGGLSTGWDRLAEFSNFIALEFDSARPDECVLDFVRGNDSFRFFDCDVRKPRLSVLNRFLELHCKNVCSDPELPERDAELPESNRD